ncbi:MAG: ubiquitin-like domain-containing protein [Anaerolineae bacterium]
MDTAPRTSFSSLHYPRGLIALTTLLVIIAVLMVGYQSTLIPVTMVIDGQQHRLRTQQDTVGALLADIGLTLFPEDHINPKDPDTPLEPRMIVQVQRARPVTIIADGHTATFRTHATSIEEALLEARVSVETHDEIKIEGEFLPANRPTGHSLQVTADTIDPVRITIHRAVPLTLQEDGTVKTLYTTAPTVGEALHRAGVTLYLADGVEPDLNERVTAGMNVNIDRSIPVTVQVDERTLRTRTHRERVDEVLADLHVVLTGQDYAIPALDDPLTDEATVKVVRVTERFVIEQEPIPFELAWQPDPELEIDYQRLLQEGARGVRERRIRVRYEDGIEVARTMENVYVAVPPTTKIMGYGTNIVIRTIDTPSGTVEYWRKIRVLATSYSASTAGTPSSAPWYGRTRLGLQMRYGIIAVDPRVIALSSNVYVPGYGIGFAGDTGGAIKGRRIDLGYDDDNLVLWYRWVDVYLLTPVPPANQINYILGP